MNRGRLPLQLPQQHKRLHIENFPSYTFHPNPNEGVWSSTKRELANTFPLDLDELIEEVIAAIEQLRRSPRTLRKNPSNEYRASMRILVRTLSAGTPQAEF